MPDSAVAVGVGVAVGALVGMAVGFTSFHQSANTIR